MGVYVSVCTRVWRSKVGIMCLSLSPLLFFLYVKANLSPCFCLPHVGITHESPHLLHIHVLAGHLNYSPHFRGR